eukprot:5140166-Alexandrium_andersonii.AAC.1
MSASLVGSEMCIRDRIRGNTDDALARHNRIKLRRAKGNGMINGSRQVQQHPCKHVKKGHHKGVWPGLLDGLGCDLLGELVQILVMGHAE